MDAQWMEKPRYTPQTPITGKHAQHTGFRANSQVVSIFTAWVLARGDDQPRQGDIEQLKQGMPAMDDDTWMQLAQLLGWTGEQVKKLGGEIPAVHPLLAATPRGQPIQPLIIDKQGVLRFKCNLAVDFLLGHCGLNLNDLATRHSSSADREQFAQLIGYSHSGFGSLSYAGDRVYERAAQEFEMREAALAQAKMQSDTPIPVQGGSAGPRL